MRFRPALLLLTLALVAACALADSTQPTKPTDVTFAPALGIDLSTFTKYDTNLYYKDSVIGTGATAVANKSIFAQYTGWLTDGTQFDSDVGGDSIFFPLRYGDGAPIPGWILGIPAGGGMKEGGIRKLIVGSAYAYGAQANGPIPAHATLIFNVHLMHVK